MATPESSPPASGGGEIVDTQNPAQSVKDTRLISRAMRERWKVPPEAKRAIVEACQELVERREARSMLFAAKILL